MWYTLHVAQPTVAKYGRELLALTFGCSTCVCLVYFVAVDDDIVEKLLQLLGDAVVGNDARTENVSLKSVAEMFYRQHEHADSEHNNTVGSDNVPGNTYGPAASTAVSSSAANACQTCVSSSSSKFPFSLSPSVEASHSTAMAGGCSVGVPSGVDSHVGIPSPNLRHSQDICMPTSSPGAPYFCIPTLPVLSPSGVPTPTGRRLHEQICSSMRQNSCCDDSEDTADRCPSISVTNAHNIPAVVSSCSWASSPCVQSLYSHASSPLLPSLSSGSSGDTLQRTVCSHGNSKTLTTASEAMSRISELLIAQCKVLVLMRGCPGSGKTTMARYACVCVLVATTYLIALNTLNLRGVCK